MSRIVLNDSSPFSSRASISVWLVVISGFHGSSSLDSFVAAQYLLAGTAIPDSIYFMLLNGNLAHCGGSDSSS